MIKLSESKFFTIPEGETTFKISAVKYDEKFGKMNITLQMSDGMSHIEKYSFKTATGAINEKAIGAFSYFARIAMNNFNLNEINEQDLVGHFVKGKVKHTVQPNKNDPNKTVTFVNISDWQVAVGFVTEETDFLD